MALGWAVAGGQAAVLYVDPSAANPSAPYTNWASAAARIQDALDAARALDHVLVTNGVYAAGSRGSYRLRVDKPVQVSSVNGPGFTVVDGGGGGGCIYLADGSGLAGFTLTNGTVGVFCQSTNAVITNCVIAGNAGSGGTGSGAHGGTLYNCTLSGNRGDAAAGAAFGVLNYCTLSDNTCFGSGGGAYQCTLNYCTLSGNRSDYRAGGPIGEGGGAYGCTLNYCTLNGNCAFYAGGGASSSTLNNCVLTDNVTAGAGAGASDSTLNNCTVASNVAGQGGGGAYNSTAYNSILWFNTPWDYDPLTTTLNYCSAQLWPHAGVGNVPGFDPQFVNLAGGNLRLKPTSPCINSGNNAYAPGPTDMDGNPRIVGGTVDIGAYEYQGPGPASLIIGCSNTACPPTARPISPTRTTTG